VTKAQIVSQDYGAHNAALMSGKVLQGNSWKKTRIIKLMPSANMIAAKVALSHENLIFPPNQGVYKMLCLGMEVGDAYSAGIEAILAHPDLSTWEFILTVESDNVPPPDGVLGLIKAMEEHPELSCIGGLYFCKGFGGSSAPHCWGDISDPVVNYRPVMPALDRVTECYGTSMGFNLWRISMFHDKRLPRPLFQTKASASGVGTQDLAFWGEARKYGYRCGVDGRIRVGHYDLTGQFGIEDFSW
jgi:hypothetical protein